MKRKIKKKKNVTHRIRVREQNKNKKFHQILDCMMIDETL